MAITPQQARQELARRELARRELARREQQPQPELYPNKIIPQFTKGLYENLPFGKRIVGMLPNAPQIEQLQAETARPQGFLPMFARGVGSVAPDLAMSSPFMRGAGLIPKIPGIAKAGLGFGAYGGTKAAVQGEPIVPSALSSAGSAALFHGAGKIGAGVVPQFGGRLGSALGGATAGAITGGEEGMALGAGLGALYPSQPYQKQTQKLAETAINYYLKPSKTLKKYANPAQAITKEGIAGFNLDTIDRKADIRLGELKEARDRIKTDIRNSDAEINLKENKALKPLWDLWVELNKDPLSHRTEIKALERNLTDLESKDLGKLNIDQAYDFIDRINNLKPSGIFTKTSTAKINSALHETYHNVREAINKADISNDLKSINKRMSDLIAAKQAINDAVNKNGLNTRFLPIGFGLYGVTTGNPILATMVGTEEVLRTPGGSSFIGKMLSTKYPKVKR